MQRAYGQGIHAVAVQDLNVVVCFARGGIVGEDGATHHGAYDLAYFRAIPNMKIMSPLNEEELRHMMYTAQLDNMGTFSIRYPRGRGVLPDWKLPMKKLNIGKGRKIKEGNDLAVISIGHVGNFALKAAQILDNENISTAVFDMRFLKPIDEELLHQILKNFNRILTVEDGTIVGGLGSAVIEFNNDNNYKSRIFRLGIPDRFIEHGTPEELYRECGFDIQGIAEAGRQLVAL
jgi:1-deoxy-D-xylulose-5-phosphate synthase